jgi:hypothetical protein
MVLYGENKLIHSANEKRSGVHGGSSPAARVRMISPGPVVTPTLQLRPRYNFLVGGLSTGLARSGRFPERAEAVNHRALGVRQNGARS